MSASPKWSIIESKRTLHTPFWLAVTRPTYFWTEPARLREMFSVKCLSIRTVYLFCELLTI